MNWLRVLLQSISFFQATKYWRGALYAFALFLVLIAIPANSIALALVAFIVAGVAYFSNQGPQS
jgi:hypothetical protein